MPGPIPVAHARIWHAPDPNLIKAVVAGADVITLQFNPETITVSGGPSMATCGVRQQQYVKDQNWTLGFETWFDVTAGQGTQGYDNVWAFISRLQYFRTPSTSGTPSNEVPVLPTLYFQWGTFLFLGQMTELSTTMEYFSPEGVPLRASAKITILGQMALGNTLAGAAAGAGVAGAAVKGAANLLAAKANQTAQQLAAQAGVSWKALAAANGIENPRRITAGTLLKIR